MIPGDEEVSVANDTRLLSPNPFQALDDPVILILGINKLAGC
jgi:hypothetical protein